MHLAAVFLAEAAKHGGADRDFHEHVLRYLLKYADSDSKAARYRCCQLLAETLKKTTELSATLKYDYTFIVVCITDARV